MGSDSNATPRGRIRDLALKELEVSESNPEYKPASLEELKRLALAEIAHENQDDDSDGDQE